MNEFLEQRECCFSDCIGILGVDPSTFADPKAGPEAVVEKEDLMQLILSEFRCSTPLRLSRAFDYYFVGMSMQEAKLTWSDRRGLLRRLICELRIYMCKLLDIPRHAPQWLDNEWEIEDLALNRFRQALLSFWCCISEEGRRRVTSEFSNTLHSDVATHRQ